MEKKDITITVWTNHENSANENEVKNILNFKNCKNIKEFDNGILEFDYKGVRTKKERTMKVVLQNIVGYAIDRQGEENE